MNIDFFLDYVVYIIIGLVVVIGFLLTELFLSKGSKSNKKAQFFFMLKSHKEVRFYNPYLNFLIYGGAGSGKTKSVGKPLLEQYIKNHYAGFIYDYKDYDITQTASYLTQKHNYPWSFYIISFVDMERTSRTNPVSPSVVTDENVFLQLLEDIYLAYLQGSQNEWTEGAKGILQGVGYIFYNEFPEKCTIPHIAMFVCSAGTDNIMKFLELNTRARMVASAFMDSSDSPKTQASYLSSLTNALSKLSFNKNVAYVLSGNDFEFNLLDPNNPKMISVCNSYQIEGIISPIVALMLSISSRQFTLNNKLPFMYFLDEATTFKIPDFQKMPSVLREYKCSFTFITQDASKIEQMYGKQAKASIESNFGNQFYGRTKNTLALQAYPIVFGKKEVERISKSKGSSRGGESNSTTLSNSKESFYDSEEFTELKAGEFICSFSDSNFKKGKFRFAQYLDEQKEEQFSSERKFHQRVEDNYKAIQDDIIFIIEGFKE